MTRDPLECDDAVEHDLAEYVHGQFRPGAVAGPAPALRVGADTYASGLCVLHVGGEIDMATASQLHDAIARALGDPAPQVRARRIVLDLSTVTFFDAHGISAVMDCRSTATRLGVVLDVVAGAHAVRRPLELTGMWQLLECHTRLEDAVEYHYANLT